MVYKWKLLLLVAFAMSMTIGSSVTWSALYQPSGGQSGGSESSGDDSSDDEDEEPDPPADTETNPTKFLDHAHDLQDLPHPPYNTQIKQKWETEIYKYEVRGHDADPDAPDDSNSNDGPIFRVFRKKKIPPNSPPGTQGEGGTYMDGEGTWHFEKDIKLDDDLANDTHIPNPDPRPDIPNPPPPFEGEWEYGPDGPYIN